MDSKSISNWVRQARYRAKKHSIYSDLEIDDVQVILEENKHKCAYCKAAAETLDCPFPLKSNAPNVPANLLPACKKCKDVKKSNDLVWMFTNEHLTKECYLAILKEILARRGGALVKAHVRLATGMVDSNG